MHRPRLQLFVLAENLFHHDIESPVGIRGAFRQCFGGAALQAAKVLKRIKQAVHVIDAQSVDETAPHELQNHLMGRIENRAILHPDRGQLVDVEKSAIVDLVGRDLPKAQTKGLIGEQMFQPIEAARLALDAVEVLQRVFDHFANVGAFLVQIRDPTPDDRDLAPPLANLL